MTTDRPAPDPIPDEWLPPGLELPMMRNKYRCVEIAGAESSWCAACIDALLEQTDSAWRAALRAERTAADARVLAVAVQADALMVRSQAVTHWDGCDHHYCVWLRRLREHEPALAAELAAARTEGADHAG